MRPLVQGLGVLVLLAAQLTAQTGVLGQVWGGVGPDEVATDALVADLRAQRTTEDSLRLRFALGRVLAYDLIVGRGVSFVHIRDGFPEDLVMHLETRLPEDLRVLRDDGLHAHDPVGTLLQLDEALRLLAGVVAEQPDWLHASLDLARLLLHCEHLAVQSAAHDALALPAQADAAVPDELVARLAALGPDDADELRALEWFDEHLLEADVLGALASRRVHPDGGHRRAVVHELRRAWRHRAAHELGRVMQLRAHADREVLIHDVWYAQLDLPSFHAATLLVELADAHPDDERITRWRPFARQTLERLERL